MLTAELVEGRRYKGELKVRPLDGPKRELALELAQAYLSVALDHVGRTREELEVAWDALGDEASAKLSAGIRKLVEDACEFDAEPEKDPTDLRKAVFLRASAFRQSLGAEDTFDRQQVLDAVAGEFGISGETVEALLYADLRGANILRQGPKQGVSAAMLVAHYDLAQAQAVLLRATRIVCFVQCPSAGMARAFFHKLKFLRLLHTVTATDDGGYRIEVDGPFSLFQSVTKYGLKLALLLPALQAMDQWSLEADLLWGKEREPLKFRLAKEGDTSPSSEYEEGAEAGAKGGASRDKAHLADETRALLEAFDRVDTPWKCRPAATLVDLPGIGLCVPDLVFTKKGAPKVYLEVMGYWSRDAVFRRVELVEKGMKERVLFAVSSRLRVSEEVLPEDASSALYVYKGTMSPRSILERVERLAGA